MIYAVYLHQIFSTLLVLCSAAALTRGNCLPECSCAPSPPQCPPGVSWVTDQCGCCKICARQFNEECSVAEPCDHIKGLRCQLGAGGEPDRGLCRAEAHGLPCEFNGHLYQHSENFNLSCQHQCSCINGVVGCMPLCPQQVPLPSWQCLQPRLVKPGDDCCEEWMCDDDNHISEDPDELTHISHTASQPHPNHITALMQPRQPAATSGAMLREMASFPMSEVLLESSCYPQTTEWTTCSSVCGIGISSRVTNNNPDCQLTKETRLCQIRQCDLQLPVKNRKCQRTVRPHELVRITFAGCATTQRYRPRTCGTCTDGRCCTPSLSRTVKLHFHCPNGESFHRNIMWIQRCSCSSSYCRPSIPAGPSFSLHNDIHTFRH